jgi:hypothetical protein
MSTQISLTDSMLVPHRVTAFRESRPDCPEGIVICLGGLRIETTEMAWRPISHAIETALRDLAPPRSQPARQDTGKVTL